MKQHALATIGLSAALAVSAGVLQAAGRAVDNPLPRAHDRAVEDAGDPSGFYTGRPGDNSYVERPSAEGDAEFAQMQVEGEADEQEPAYHGRPMDNPHLAQ